VVAPADPLQASAALPEVHELPGPVYIRLGKESTGVPGLDGRFELGRAELIGDGDDIAIVALGAMAGTAVGAAELLQSSGVEATVAVVSSLNPSPVEDLAELLADIPLALSVEAHYVNGGVGSLVAEVIAEHGLSCRLVRAGLRVAPAGHSGGREYLYERHGLSSRRLAAAGLKAIASAVR
jgi:transketolase